MSVSTANWVEHTRVQLKNSTLPKGMKSQVWRDFLAGLETDHDVLRSRVRALEIESAWADATIDFYTFTKKNRGHIAIDGEKVLLDDDTLLTEYNTKLSHAKDEWRKLQDAVREQMRIQADIEKETGDPVEKLQALVNAK